MSSAGAALEVVPPAYFWTPPRAVYLADEAVEFAHKYRLGIDPEQEMILRALFAEREDGRLAAREVCIICARQNLKTHVLKIAALFDLFVMRTPLNIWTAHQFKATRQVFRELVAMIKRNPELRAEVKRFGYANGEEEIELLYRDGDVQFENPDEEAEARDSLDGPRLLFWARSGGGGRSFACNRLTLDEALFLSDDEQAALMPTMSAVADSQIRYGSSACLTQSTALMAMRDRGRRLDDPALFYAEWCAPYGTCDDGKRCTHEYGIAEGCALDRLANWIAANPAMYRRIEEETVAGERRTLKWKKFAGERLGWHADEIHDDDSTAFDFDQWERLTTPLAQPSSLIAFAVDTTPSRDWSSISVASPASFEDDDEHPEQIYVELVAHNPGNDWVIDWLIEHVGKWSTLPIGVAPAGPAGSLLPEMEKAGLNVRALTRAEETQATGQMYDGIRDATVCHGGQEQLDEAVKLAKAINRGDGAFSLGRRTSDGDISPIVSATYARFVLAEYASGVGDAENNVH